MNEIWSKNRIKDYNRMICRHLPLWNYVEKLVKHEKIQSIADVGGGYGYARKFTYTYALFDQNLAMIKYSVDNYPLDFCELGAFQDSTVQDHYDLVLILGVVEHAGVLEPFIKKALDLTPKIILVSFFGGLRRDAVSARKKNSIQLRFYSERTVVTVVKQLGLKYELFNLQPDPAKYPYKYTVYDSLLKINNCKECRRR